MSNPPEGKGPAKTGTFIDHERSGGFTVRVNDLIRSTTGKDQLTTTRAVRMRTDALTSRKPR